MKAARLVVLGVAVAACGIATYLAASSKAPPLPPQMGTISLSLRSLLDTSLGPAEGANNTKEGPINALRFGASLLGNGH